MLVREVKFLESIARLGTRQGRRVAKVGVEGVQSIEWNQPAQAIIVACERGEVSTPWANVLWCVTMPAPAPVKRGPGRPKKAAQ